MRALNETEEVVAKQDPARQIFSPLFRVTKDHPLIGRSRAALLRALPPAHMREFSFRKSHAAQGVAGALVETGNDEDPEWKRVTDMASIALMEDPDNYHAYVWMARGQANLGRWDLACDFLLTGYARMRLAERILGLPVRTSDQRCLRAAVETAAGKYLTEHHWYHLNLTAVWLEFVSDLSFDFPRLRRHG